MDTEKPMNTLARMMRIFKRRRSPAILAAEAGVAPEARRGTVLVLILGALALISVVTLVYMNIGRGDSRASATIVQKTQVKDTVQNIADYLSNTIADDVTATIVSGTEQPASGNSFPIAVRESWDFPYVDAFRRSVIQQPTVPALAIHKFSAAGSYSDSYQLGSGNPSFDPRTASDPWLSPLLPTNLIPPNSITPGADLPERFHDWWSISNFAPDGRFVNLWNLAPKINGQRYSGFDALPVNQQGGAWTPQAPQFNGSGSLLAEMSYGLTLVSNVTNSSFPVGTPQQMLAGGIADPNIPAHWTMWQHSAFRLANVDAVWGPGDAEFIGYQWADTDGDGFVDARWFELVDASDRLNPVSFLPKDDRFRWFIAARAIDLSGSVNVNTATDFRKPPKQTTGVGSTPAPGTPLGLYPSDIDLYRLLRMNDVYDIFGPAGGYNGLRQGLGKDNFGSYDQASARKIGETAYNAIRRSLLPQAESVADWNLDLSTADNTLVAPLTGDARAMFYASNAGPSGAAYFVGNGKSFRITTKFGMPELLELLTRHGVNDPETTSRLEQATAGRYNRFSGAAQNSANEYMGPLREGRSSRIELTGTDIVENGGQGNGVADQQAMRRVMTDTRRLLTTESSSRPIRANIINIANDNNLRKLVTSDLTVDAVGAAQAISRPLPATGPLPTNVDRDPVGLFDAYAEALLPYSWRNGMWASASGSANNANHLRLRTLNYAYSPELALRMAANLAANFGDMYDTDDEPSTYTLLIDQSKIAQVAANTTAYPSWNIQGPTANSPRPGRLDLNHGLNQTPPVPGAIDRLAKTGDRGNTDTPAINVFGIEAQPFLTEVVSFCIYCDAPSAVGGDNEYSPPAINRITMDGTFPATNASGPGNVNNNSDFLGQVLAFQLTNPFNTVVKLTGRDYATNFQVVTNDTDYSDFYLEFNTNYFKFVKDDPNGAQSIVLQPGETRTFYILSHSFDEIRERWSRAAGDDALIPADALERFLDNQLGIATIAGITYGAAGIDLTTDGTRVKPIRLRAMNARSGASVPASNSIDLFGGGNIKAKQNIYLWRVPRAGFVTGAASDTRYRHILADRLHDPGVSGSNNEPTLDRRIPTNRSNIRNTVAGQEPFPIGATPPDAEDNTGFTIALWGSVKRRDNPANLPLGALPAYCLEAKWTGGALKNIAETDRAKPSSLQKTDFDNDNADITTEKLINKTIIPATPTGPLPGGPGNYPGVLVQANGTYATMTVAAHLKSHTPHIMPANGNTVSYSNLYPQVPLDNSRFDATLAAYNNTKISTLRIADMLLPLAIGPMQDPGANPPQGAPSGPQPVDTFLTLGEAMGVALNYSNPPQTGDLFSIYYRVGDRPTGFNTPPSALSAGALDRGNIALDRFAPFEDFTGASAGTVPTFDPPTATGGGKDEYRWPSIPLGLHILDVFRTLDPLFGSLTQGAAGLVNMNTAPLSVLRTVPLLSPSRDTTSLPRSPATQLEWADWKQLAGVAATGRPLTDINCDVAAALQSYRDKLRVFNRFGQIDRCDDTTINPFAAAGADGRYQTTLITALRENPGFASVGEMMAVINRSPTRRIQTNDAIDQLGSDNNASGTLGTNSILYKSTANATLKSVDGITDDYSEKLLLATSTLNTLSVRGEVFAVWFVVHGYQKSDTENLGPNDPLTPSVAKRFVMVVDRSGVTNAGQKPKILLFAEVPL